MTENTPRKPLVLDQMRKNPFPWMLLNAPYPTVVIDNNILLRDVVRGTRRKETSFLCTALQNGVFYGVITARVLQEFFRHVPRRAQKEKLDPVEMKKYFWDFLAPHLHLAWPPELDSPRIQALRDRDSDDLPTAYLVEMVSPAYFLHDDNDFSGSGYPANIPRFADLVQALMWPTQKDYLMGSTVVGGSMLVLPIGVVASEVFKASKTHRWVGPLSLAALLGLGYLLLGTPERRAKTQEHMALWTGFLQELAEGLTKELQEVETQDLVHRTLREERAVEEYPVLALEHALVRILIRSRRPLAIHTIHERLEKPWKGSSPDHLADVLQSMKGVVQNEIGWTLNWPTVQQYFRSNEEAFLEAALKFAGPVNR